MLKFLTCRGTAALTNNLRFVYAYTELAARPAAIEELKKSFARLEKLKERPEVCLVLCQTIGNIVPAVAGSIISIPCAFFTCRLRSWCETLAVRPKCVFKTAENMYTLVQSQNEKHWTEDAFKRVEDSVLETKKWLEDKLAEQEKRPLTEDPAFLAAELSRKVCTLSLIHI